MKKDSPNTPKAEPKHTKRMWKPAPSLAPGPTMIEAAAERKAHPYATAIRDAWQFKHKVKVLSKQDYQRLVERGTVTF